MNSCSFINRFKNNKGFTLVELLVAIVILGIITGMAFPLIRNVQQSNFNKKHTVYSSSLESGAKLYTSSYSEDMFGYSKAGCYEIPYSKLSDKSLVKNIDVSDETCDTEDTFVVVKKVNDSYSYAVSLKCKDTDTNKTVYDDTTSHALDCNGGESVAPTLTVTPDNNSSVKSKNKKITVKVTSKYGLLENAKFKYAWTTNTSNISSLNYTEYSYKNKYTEETDVSLSTDLNTTSLSSGKYYLVIIPSSIYNAVNDYVPHDPLTFGPYVVDHDGPKFNDSVIISSESTFNSLAAKFKFNVTDNFSSESDITMCISNTGFEKGCKYVAYSKSYSWNVGGSYDGGKRTIYVTMKDAAGNITKKSFTYTVALKYGIGYDYNGGIKGTYAPTFGYYDTELTISNPHKSIVVSFDINKSGAKASSINNISTKYTFTGWTATKLHSSALTGLSTANTSWSGTVKTVNTKFKRLSRSTTTDVKFTANWSSPIITLPTLTKTGYTCKWNSTSTCGSSGYIYASGGNYIPTNVTSRTFYGCCTANSYKLTYDSDGGNACSPTSITKNYDSPWGTLCTPTRTGYNFNGWYTSKNGEGTKVTASTIVAGNLTVYASWSKKIYKITYNGNGSSGGSTSQTSCAYSDTCTLAGNGFSKTGYTFAGWYTAASGGTKYDSTTNLTGDITVYAHWTANTYTITYNGNGSTGGSTATTSCTYGASCSLSSNGFSKTGYTFDGWYTTENGGTKYGSTTTLTGNITVYAHWKINSYTITYNGNGSTGGSTAVTTCDYNASCSLRSNGFSKTGYTFDGWYTATSGGTKYDSTTKLTGNITVYAHWTANTYKITYNGNGSTGGSTAQTSCAYSDTCTLAGNGFSKTGYTFDGWYTATSGGTKYGSTTNLTGNITVYAHWKINSYTITYNGNDSTGGSTAVTTCDYNASCSLRSNGFSKTGYSFDGWYTAASGGTKYGSTTTLTGNKTVYAHWTINSYTITYKPNGGSGTTRKTTCDYNANCSLRSNGFSKSGYTFTGWYTSASGGTKYGSSTKLTGNITVYAHWKLSYGTNNCKIRGNRIISTVAWSCQCGSTHTTAYNHYCSDSSGKLQTKSSNSSLVTYAYVCPTSPFGTSDGWIIVSD